MGSITSDMVQLPATDPGVHIMSWINLTISAIIIIYGFWLLRHGRRLDREMYLIYLFAGVWSFVAYGLYVVDTYIADIMTRTDIRLFIFRPVIFVLICTILAALIRTGWHRDD